MTFLKNKKAKKRFYIFLYAVAGLIIFLLASGFFLSLQKEPASIYVFPENPKQGDTVFIRVKTDADKITGNFGQQQLLFYKKGNSSEWISFLGIDADQEPGGFKIYASTSNAEHLEKEIKVVSASFSSGPEIPAPAYNQNGITNKNAVYNIRKNDNPALNKFLGNFTQTPYFNLPFSFPLSIMKTSGFSFGKFIGFGKFALQHLGVDLRAPEKTEIYAVNDGKVVATLDLSNYGKTVIIDHGLDIFSLYLHLDEFKISDGQMVRRGQLIGLSGNTGYVTAPHLHFSMRVGSSRVDPVEFIKATQKINENFFIADITAAFLNIINNFK